MTEYFSAFLIGLVSASHCLGMCGGLMVAAGLNSGHPSLAIFYNVGRISTYVLLGTLLAFFSNLLPDLILPYLKILSGFLLIFSAFYFLGLGQFIKSFEKLGLPLWKTIQPLTKKLLPVQSNLTAYILGILWGFIPCGLVYTAVAFSLTLNNVIGSSLAMLFFGIGTLPAMIGSALMANKIRPLLYHPKVKFILSAILVIFALLIWAEAFQNIR